MTWGKCVVCKFYRKLMGKICALCTDGLKKSFLYSIGGKKVSKRTYDAIMKRGYIIPEEIEDIRNEEC